MNAPVDQSLDNGHLSLLELLLSISASSVGEVHGMADLDVIGQGDVLNLNTNRTQEQRNDLGKQIAYPPSNQKVGEVRTLEYPTFRKA